MDDQLEAVRQDIRSVKDKIVKTEQDLAIAKQAENKGGEEEVKFLHGQLLSLNNQLSGLQEKENILLRRQASGSSLGGMAAQGTVRKWGSNMVNVKVKGETEPSPVQLYLAAGESDQATSGHIFMDNLRAIMHGLPVDVPIMVCEDVHAMGNKGALLHRDVNDLSQKQFSAGSELIVWPDTGSWKKLRIRVWRFVAKKPIVIGIITVCCTLAVAAATLVMTIHYKKNPPT
ncbi:TPA: hypothetical protein ACH3X1_008513 [Trebouxia sp. C0004]